MKGNQTSLYKFPFKRVTAVHKVAKKLFMLVVMVAMAMVVAMVNTMMVVVILIRVTLLLRRVEGT